MNVIVLENSVLGDHDLRAKTSLSEGYQDMTARVSYY